MDLSDIKVPHVFVTRKNMDDWTENCILLHFMLGQQLELTVSGLKFSVENSTDYNKAKDPIPFRHRVFSSDLDGRPIRGKDVLLLIESDAFKRLNDNDAVSLCCVGILQLVLLGVKDRLILQMKLRRKVIRLKVLLGRSSDAPREHPTLVYNTPCGYPIHGYDTPCRFYTAGGGGDGSSDVDTHIGSDGEGDLDLLRDKDDKAGMQSDDGGTGLTGKVVISSLESNMMTNGTSTPTRSVVARKDATHLKGQYKGTNLIAVGMDGNNQIVPIAFGICKGETVQDEFPLAYHVVCCRHLMMNLYLKRDKTKALFWRICKAYTTEEFSRSMSHLQDIQTDAYDKLCQVGPQRSSSAHCPLVNSVESVNACTVVYMKMPVLKLTETYRAMVQEWYYQRRKLTGTCQCRKWQLSGIPCGHVISVTGSIVLMKLQEALDEKAIFKEHILTLMHRFADRFTEHTVEINNLMVLQDHPLIDYGKYALGCMT
nr:transposase, MuDR, MULE transposase domain protein [Tanacetum cinerariifolium]